MAERDDTAASVDAPPAYSGTDNLEVMAEAVRYACFLRGLIRRACPPGAASALDFGAGLGTFSDALADTGCRVVCVEADASHRQRLADRGFAVAPLEAVADGAADYVFAMNVIEHIADDGGTLAALRRKLRPGGVLLVYVPAFRLLWSGMDDKVGHLRRYTRRFLADTARDAGFDVRECRYADSADFAATLLFKAFGNRMGAIDRRALRVFDRLVFPAGRALDRLGAAWLFGKNVYCIAVRGNA